MLAREVGKWENSPARAFSGFSPCLYLSLFFPFFRLGIRILMTTRAWKTTSFERLSRGEGYLLRYKNMSRVGFLWWVMMQGDAEAFWSFLHTKWRNCPCAASMGRFLLTLLLTVKAGRGMICRHGSLTSVVVTVSFNRGKGKKLKKEC